MHPSPRVRGAAAALATATALALAASAPGWADVEDAATIRCDGQLLEQDVDVVLDGDVLLVSGCTFAQSSLRVYGQGDVYIRDSVFHEPPSLGVSILVDGRVEIDGVSIFGPGSTPTGYAFSGLTIHGATEGGIVSNVLVTDFVGNGVLVEEVLPIVGLELRDIEVARCGGAVWFFNAVGCSLDGLFAEDADYRPRPHYPETQPYPCVRDARLVPGDRVRGDTELSRIECR